MVADIERITKALSFAAEAHRNQRRKGAAQEPYINHLIEVFGLVARSESRVDTDTLIAALLHDVVEDTPRTYEDVSESFGERVAEIVRENSDDMSLPKAERRQARLAAMARKSREARIVKIADVISNLRAIAVSPPAGWSSERKLAYLEDCRRLVEAARGTEVSIERIFDETAADVDRAIRDDAPFQIDGCEVVARQLNSEIGQPVHLVYMLNTEDRPLETVDVDRLCQLIGERFPAATVQPAEAVYERGRRSILIVRIRTDGTEDVVDLAQRLCVEFRQRFVGIEVNGRYIRIYSDDTG
ncbi:hypothetical protein AUC68_13830 [Methyloceanibacter methanicus]|uniref:HD/PDEase domain-containing protein n=1 Tax=Methyloceanibacter methanicus TaxID=1774968 RepID=A0A1E3W4D3_9HYPH|nr:HD domain-containing protein [Methyloceanibacter methanicus]ODS00675.1 hypothetical protein AUC68_13830 [Methyloceanibacter methanicus]